MNKVTLIVIAYYTFIGLMAYFVTPWALLLVLVNFKVTTKKIKGN